MTGETLLYRGIVQQVFLDLDYCAMKIKEENEKYSYCSEVHRIMVKEIQNCVIRKHFEEICINADLSYKDILNRVIRRINELELSKYRFVSVEIFEVFTGQAEKYEERKKRKRKRKDVA